MTGNLIYMKCIIANIKNPVLVSAWAAVVSAFFAGLAFLSSRRLSRRDMVNILKVEILRVVSSVQGRDAWTETVNLSIQVDGGPRVGRLAGLLGSKYKKRKWLWLIPVDLEELKREGYQNLLGL